MMLWVPKKYRLGFTPLIKKRTFLTVMTVCRIIFHNGGIVYTCYKFMKVLTIHIIFVVYVVNGSSIYMSRSQT